MFGSDYIINIASQLSSANHQQARNYELSRAGAQPMKKGTLIKFLKTIRPLNSIIQIQKWRKYRRILSDVIALTTNDSYCYFVSR